MNAHILKKTMKYIFFFVFISFFMASVVLAGNPRVVTMTVQPSTPNFGDRITVTIIVCANKDQEPNLGLVISTLNAPADARLSGIGQVFIVSTKGINAHTSVPAASQGGEVGYVASPPAGGAYDCNTCGSTNDGHTFTFTYGATQPLTVPDASFFPGCTNTKLYMHVVFKDNNLNDGEYATQTACQIGSTSWTIPTLPTSMSIHKSMEGVLQLQNDLMLVSVDYEYANGAPKIMETIPNLPGGASAWTLMSIGPLGMYNAPCAPPCAVTAGQGITWTLANKTNQKGSTVGTVWFLLKVTGANPANGTRVNNTASSTITGPDGTLTDSSTTSIIAGQPAITLTKSQSSDNPLYEDNLTYYLEYQINGSALVAYQPFDDLALGTYTGIAPNGWQFRPSTSNGSWLIHDDCATGDRVITGDTTAGDDYPGLLFTGYPMNSDVTCLGIVESEVMINPTGDTSGGGGYEGSDSLVIIRDNGFTAHPAAMAFGLVLSIDDFIGTNANGNVGFQRCGGNVPAEGPFAQGNGIGASNCEWPKSVQFPIVGNKWYKVKIQTGPTTCDFSAKVWVKGDPEPGAWTITWTDPYCNADGFNCSNPANIWYAGVAEQGGATAYTQDSYNNFVMLKPRVSANTELYDTVPAGIVLPYGELHPAGKTYNITPTGPGTLIGWNLFNISDEGGSITWWGKVNTCNPITNIGAIDGNDPIIPVLSNDVIANPICPTPVITLDKTANPMSLSVGDKVTFTIHVCNSAAGPAAAPFSIWDTVPSQIVFGGFVSASGGFTAHGPAGQYIYWDIASFAAGACTDVVWWGTLNHFPMNPLETDKYYFVYNDRLMKGNVSEYSYAAQKYFGNGR